MGTVRATKHTLSGDALNVLHEIAIEVEPRA